MRGSRRQLSIGHLLSSISLRACVGVRRRSCLLADDNIILSLHTLTHKEQVCDCRKPQGN
jgi:hypothetical protein